ncbi:G-protein coupled receptor 87-like [Anneissia japonica]|uniref:G-protein coupled receptor 87-like n=1 Tax=Anneissia japonica TaxID=1529436 RepID=UPI0014258ADB|nr:G-protein coupled receptor 87-like [Anneissia japonica]
MDGTRNDTAPIELQDPLVLVLARWVLASNGILANSFVIFVFVYNKTYKKSLSLKLLLHQTIVDLISSVMFLIFHNTDVPDGTRGTLFYKMEFLFKYMSVTSTFNFVMLTIECYIAVIHPLLYRQKSLHRKITYLSLAIPHVCGIILTLYVAINVEKNPNVTYCTGNEVKTVAAVLLITVYWMVPISIMLYCYIQMLLKLHKTSRVSQQPSSRPKDSRQIYRVKSDLLTTLILIAFVYILTITPSSVFLLIHFIYHRYNFTYELSMLFLELNLSMNPFIYCVTCKDFQRGVCKIKRYIFQDFPKPVLVM